MQAKKYTNYKITNLIDGKVYIGYHYGTEDDGYLCSAGGELSHFWNAVRKYEPGCEGLSSDEIKSFYAKSGFINFYKEIIQYFDDYGSMLDGEKYWIQFYRDLLGPENVYNIQDGGEDGWTGVNRYLDDHPEIRSEEQRRRLESGTHVFLNLTEEQLSAKASKASKTRFANGTHHFLHLTEEQLSRRAKKTAQKQIEEGKHPWQNVPADKRSEQAKKGARTRQENGTNSFQNLSDDQLKKQIANSKASHLIEWVFFNPTTSTYKVHNLYWKTRLKEGYTERLCYFSSWPQYCIDNNLDPNLISGVSNS